MHVITLLNEKGGVGKTTLATHIAAGLAIKGHRVLLVDTDAQGHATLMMGHRKQPGLYNLLARRESWKKVMRFVQPDFYSPSAIEGRLYLLPSNVETRAIPSVVSDLTLFARRIAELRSSIDVVIVDTPPTPSMLHGSVYLATDYLLYPTQSHFLSFDGLAESMARLEEITANRSQFNLPNIQILGIVPTMHRAQTVDQSENLHDLQERFGVLVWDSIANRTAWTEATSSGKLVWMIDDSAAAAHDIQRVIDRVSSVVSHERQAQ